MLTPSSIYRRQHPAANTHEHAASIYRLHYKYLGWQHNYVHKYPAGRYDNVCFYGYYDVGRWNDHDYTAGRHFDASGRYPDANPSGQHSHIDYDPRRLYDIHYQ